MTTTRIPELSVSPRLWSLLGTTLYSQRPILPITVRELLQNAHDAVLARYPDQDIPTTAITFDLSVNDPDYHETCLECQDAGVGMTADTILDKYLCLGASGKDVGVGGWGIAKAAIIGACSDWSIHTHNLHLEQRDIIAQHPLKTTAAPLDGTRITLYYQLSQATEQQRTALTWTPYALTAALSYLVHSDSACTVRYHQESLATQKWYCTPPELPDTPVARGGTDHWTWRAYQCDPLTEYHALHCADYQGQSTTYPIPSQNRVFWRLNGLVQCYDYTDSPACWIIDVETAARPGDPNYPFGPSRERPLSDLQQIIQDIIEPHAKNPLTSAQLRTERERKTKPTEIWYTGGLMDLNHPNDNTATARATTTHTTAPTTRRFSAFVPHDQPAIHTAPEPSPLDIQMLVRGAHLTRSNPTAPKNVKLQAAWLEVLRVAHELTKIDERWGIGFTFMPNTIAERYWHAGAAYYLINPRAAKLRLTQPRETLLTMIFEACHELAHHQYRYHTEYFTAFHSQLYRTVIQQIPAFDHALAILSGQGTQLSLTI